MSYWTLEGVFSLLPEYRVLQLLCGEGTTIVVEPPNAAYQAIVTAGRNADSQVDSYLRGRFTLPLSTVPPEITDVANAFLVCFLFAQSDTDNGTPRLYTDLRTDGIRYLKELQENKASLEIDGPTTIFVNKTTDDRLCTNDVFKAYRFL